MDRMPGERLRGAAGPSGSAAFVCALLLCAAGCTRDGDPGTRAVVDAAWTHERAAIREIALDLPIDLATAEFSGMDWWGDRLVLLPQYPEVFTGGEGGALPVIERARLRAYLDGTDTTAIRPALVPFDDAQLPVRVQGWDGYEALAFHGSDAYLTIECLTHGGWVGVLVRAAVSGDLERIVVDDAQQIEIPGASRRPNFTEEALVVVGDDVLSVHELNGRRVNREPRALRFDGGLGRLTPWVFPRVEYRVTDATAVDDEGRFWVFNQFWPGEASAVDARDDDLAAGDRPSGRPVERILPLRVRGDSLVLDRARPIVELITRADDVARNWEGLVRWGDEGVLLVTDRHPRTIFAFVAWP